MPDKRTVDELSIEELERILAIRKRQARQTQLDRMKRNGRVVASADALPAMTAASMPGSEAIVAEAGRDEAQKRKRPAFEEEFDQHAFKRGQRPDEQHIWRAFVDRSLLLLEIAAVVGLFIVGGVLLTNIGTLQRETAQAQARADENLRALIPTIEPTPQLQLANIVLPGGHTPPTEPGGGQFNFNEIPANLRALVRDQVFLPPEIERPQPTAQTPRRIIIPDINVDHVIVQGVDWEALTLGVGQVLNGATPTDPTSNIALAAHNDIYGEIFRHLDQLEPGMQFQIVTESAYHTYVITEKRIVNPDDVYVLESRGRATATLISCYPYQVNTQRIIIFADKVN